MREVILSVDGDRVVYLVPDAERYRVGADVSYTEADFID